MRHSGIQGEKTKHWGRERDLMQRDLARVIFLAVRDALYAPARPDSKRQERRRQRDLARHGARIMKASGEVYCAGKSTNARKELRREMREVRERMREEMRREQLKMARMVADRLMGRRRHAA